MVVPRVEWRRTSRKDFTAFGEENVTAQRTSALAYSGQDEIRNGYTGYEKDSESGLDFAQARYYNADQGRFTSVDPLISSASTADPQSFNRYSYVMNSPYKFSDPLGLLPLTSAGGACAQWCPGTGGMVIDGSGITGRDASLDWVPTLIQGFRARSEDAAGSIINLTTPDRKSLQSALNRIAPGSYVTGDGRLYVSRRNPPGNQLLLGIGSTGRNLTLVVNHRRETYATHLDDLRSKADFLYGRSTDIIVMFDPARSDSAYLAIRSRRGFAAVSDVVPPFLMLGHELIHAYNHMRGGEWAHHDLGTHNFSDEDIRYHESWTKAEFRAVGLGYSKPGDITENDLRKQLGLSPEGYVRQSRGLASVCWRGCWPWWGAMLRGGVAMAIFKQLILMGVMFLYGHLAIWGQDTLCNETPNNMRLKIGKQTGEEFEIYVDLINKGSNPVYISTDPIQINGSRGFYLSVDRDESSTLVVSTRVFGPIIYSPYSSHRYVTLRKLEPKQYFPFTVKVRFPIKETLPPVDDPRMARVITRKEIEKVTFELGFFPEDVTLLDLLKSKPFDWTVNGEELLYTGDSKGKHLFDIQQLARCSTKIAGYQ